MKTVLLAFFLFIASNAFPQEYNLTFTGTGETGSVDSVRVENLTRQISITVKGTDVLHLKGTTGSHLPVQWEEGARIYPNPVRDAARLEFSVKTAGRVSVILSDIAGRMVDRDRRLLESGRHQYEITGLGRGIHLVEVTGESLYYSLKLTGISGSGKVGKISYGSRLNPWDKGAGVVVLLKSASAAVDMDYTDGDQLLFTGYSGDNRTVVVDSPSQSKAIGFGFWPCADADGRNYAVVKIGDQVWMSENLAYLPAVSPPSAESYTAPYYYVYRYSGTDVAEAKQNPNYSAYGVLYNWPAALTACPAGWHLPSDAEWKQLEMALGMIQAQADATGWRGTDQGTQMKTTSGWSDNGNGTNSSGFSGLPGGGRGSNGGFGNIGADGLWWSSSEASSSKPWYRGLSYRGTFVYRDNHNAEGGFSVRCLRDEGPSAAPTADFIASKTSVTIGDSIQFTDKSTEMLTSWQWDFGDGTGSDQQNPVKAYEKTGTFTVKLTVGNASGSNTKTMTDYITVTDPGGTGQTGKFTDARDGHEYDWVEIGDQVWMSENLAYLPSVSPPASESYTAPYYYVYNYSGTDVSAAKQNPNYTTYGVLYNWPAALTACPAGWHLPSDAEWKQLEVALGMTQAQADASGWRGTDQGTQMKSTSGWNSNGNGTNSSGFSGLPGGDRYDDGNFVNIGIFGVWWSSTELSTGNAWGRLLYYGSTNVYRYDFTKEGGFSVRCLRDF